MSFFKWSTVGGATVDKGFYEKNWYADRYWSAILQRNFAVVVLAGAMICTSLSVVTIIEVTKSKTLKPFVLEIDKNTGVTTLIDSVDIKVYSIDEAVNHSNVINYIRTRRGF